MGHGSTCSASSDAGRGGVGRTLSAAGMPQDEDSVEAGLVRESLAMDWGMRSLLVAHVAE